MGNTISLGTQAIRCSHCKTAREVNVQDYIHESPERLASGSDCSDCVQQGIVQSVGLSFHNDNNLEHVVRTIRMFKQFHEQMKCVYPDGTVQFM